MYVNPKTHSLFFRMGAGAAKPAGENGQTTGSNGVANYKKFEELLNPENVMDLYTAGKELGSGNMATVYEYTHKLTGKHYAAKVVLKRTLDKSSDFTNELEILGHLKGHPHILELEV